MFQLIIEWCEQNVVDQLDDSKTLEYFGQKPFCGTYNTDYYLLWHVWGLDHNLAYII